MLFQILEIKLISNLFAIPLTFLVQLEKLIELPKNILVSLLFKEKASRINVNRLDITKISQDSHISTKTIKQFPKSL